MSLHRNHVAVISLGCAKNRVDSEHMLGLLQSRGFGLVRDPESADIAVVNTCGFIQDAVQEAVDTILEVAKLKKKGSLKKLLVVGCLVQRYGYKLKRELPEVDGWLGTGEIHRIGDLVEHGDANEKMFHIGRPTYLADHHTPRVRTTPSYTAYLKIAEGCSHRCTFCTIPCLRGPFRSRSLQSLIAEAAFLGKDGVKELNLIAQDTTAYGADLVDGPALGDLLDGLLDVPRIEWIRLMYCHPDRISDELLDQMENHKRICPYLDVPLQHVNSELLKAMGRTPTGETPQQLISRIRSKNRAIALRTTLMVGFPGETDQMFRELCDFVREVRFEHLGVFVYSPEKGTPAAHLPLKVDPVLAGQRREEIMRIQQDVSLRINRRLVGSIVPVLVEGFSPETHLLLTGRTDTMAPDVDERVLINKGEGRVGEITSVRVTEAHAYDLIGEIAE
jgi:ribosomal protein S12 methylthiotransferase